MNQARTLIAISVIVFAYGRPASASTININVDPGEVGPVAGNLLELQLPQLSGTQLPRDETIFDVRFTNEKYMVLSHVANGDFLRYGLIARYTPPSVSIGLADGDDGDYFKEYGLLAHSQLLSSWEYVSLGRSEGNLGVSVEYNRTILDLQDVRFHGLRFGIDASRAFQLSEATLTIRLFGLGEMRIGQIPEPSSVVMLISAFIVYLRLGFRFSSKNREGFRRTAPAKTPCTLQTR